MALSATTGTTRGDTTWTKIFVGGLPYHTTDESLKAYFDTFGAIEEAVVITDRQTNKSRGYGFVTMADKEGADKACKDPNPVIDGRKANVNLAILGAKPRGVQPAMYPSFGLTAAKAGQTPMMTVGQLGLPQMFYPPTMVPPTGASLLMPQATSPISPAAAAANPYGLDYNTAAAAAYLSAASATNAAAAAAAANSYPAAAAAATTAFDYPGATTSYAAMNPYPYGLPQTALTGTLPTQFPAAQQN